jgi:hypothetical protein
MSEEETLQVPVLLEPLGNRPGDTAHLGSPFNLSVEAGTPEEALGEIARAVLDRLQAAGCVMSLALPLKPVKPAASWLPDNELTKEWQRAVEEYRRECDEADRRRILR